MKNPKSVMTPPFHYWVALSYNFKPQLWTTKREAQEEARACRINGEQNVRVIKVKLVEVK